MSLTNPEQIYSYLWKEINGLIDKYINPIQASKLLNKKFSSKNSLSKQQKTMLYKNF